MHLHTTLLRRLTSAVIAVGTLVACGSDDTSTATTLQSTTLAPTTTTATTTSTTTTTLAPTTTVAPLATAELEASIAAALEAWRMEAGIPGAALSVSLPDRSAITVTAGVRDLTTDEPVRVDDHWRIASLTKPMVSTAVLQLVEQGLVELDAPVATYLGAGWAEGYVLDGVDYGDLVTVAQVLSHTEGFKEYAFDPSFYLLVSDRLDVPMTPREVIDWAISQGPQYVPGTGYLYNTVGHVVAGLIIESVTGQPAETVLGQSVFAPSEADDAYLTPREFPPTRVPAGYVQGLLRDALGLIPGLATYTEQATVGDFFDVTAVPQALLTSAPFTGGGVEAQLDDVARIFRAMFDGTLLQPDTVETFTTTVVDTTYALGIDVGELDGTPVYSHGGGVPGFRSHARYDPQFDVSLAISSNLIPVEPDVGTLADQVLRVVREALAD